MCAVELRSVEDAVAASNQHRDAGVRTSGFVDTSTVISFRCTTCDLLQGASVIIAGTISTDEQFIKCMEHLFREKGCRTECSRTVFSLILIISETEPASQNSMII